MARDLLPTSSLNLPHTFTGTIQRKLFTMTSAIFASPATVVCRIVLLPFFVLSVPAFTLAQERQWQDASGLYHVTASLVTADDRLVVLKKSDGELIVLNRIELSVPDREFLMQQTDSLLSTASADSTPPDTAPVVPSVKNLETLAAIDGDVVPPETTTAIAAELSKWSLRNGDVLQGKLVGFGSQTFNVERRGGVVRVNDIEIKNLPPAYELILPAVVSKIDQKPIANLRELEKHIAAGGGGPFAYVISGIQLDLKNGGLFTVPLEFLEPAEASLVTPGFERWQAARAETVSKQDRYDTDTRERLLLESYVRSRGEERVQARALKMIELGLLSVNAGVTELWEVGLLPASPYGFPRSVVVPGRDSLSAQRLAVAQFPGWQIGYARKLSD
jgi:hypothetical protein